MMKVQILVVCLWMGTVLALPPHGTSGSSEEEDGDMGVMIAGCLTENWRDEETEEANMVRVGTCLKCLEEAGDPLSARGLPMVQACLATYMPELNEACATDIANVRVGDKKSGLQALDCFEDTLEYMGAEWCLNKSAASEITDKMTEAVGCVMELHKNVTDFVRLVQTKALAGEDGGTAALKALEQAQVKAKLMQVITMAHCDVAADGDTARSSSCKQCFGQVAVTEAGIHDKTRLMGELAKCSTNYLLPYYQECQGGLDSLVQVTDPAKREEQGAAVQRCYLGKLIRHVVHGCLESSTEPTVESLFKTMHCGRLHVMQWAMQNTGPEQGGMLRELLKEWEDYEVEEEVEEVEEVEDQL